MFIYQRVTIITNVAWEALPRPYRRLCAAGALATPPGMPPPGASPLKEMRRGTTMENAMENERKREENKDKTGENRKGGRKLWKTTQIIPSNGQLNRASSFWKTEKGPQTKSKCHFEQRRWWPNHQIHQFLGGTPFSNPKIPGHDPLSLAISRDTSCASEVFNERCSASAERATETCGLPQGAIWGRPPILETGFYFCWGCSR